MGKKVKALGMVGRLTKSAVYARWESPIGELTLIADEGTLRGILWSKDWKCPLFSEAMSRFQENASEPVLLKTVEQLNEYFLGQRVQFDIPLLLDGTDFQKKAWGALQKIPYGETLSYEAQAMVLGGKNKVRAVGGANGNNPISIVVPCHRVIAKDGSLGGFGGGLPAKQYLLELEAQRSF